MNFRSNVTSDASGDGVLGQSNKMNNHLSRISKISMNKVSAVSTCLEILCENENCVM